MWLRVLIAVCVTTRAWSQHTYASQKVQHDGTQFEWGWQLTPVDAHVPLDNFFVQTGPHIQYADNIGVFQNAAPLVNAANRLNYNNAIPYQIYQNPVNQTQGNSFQGFTSQAPWDIFLLHQQFPVPVTQTQQNNLGDDSNQYTNAPQSSYNANTYKQTGYNTQTEHPSSNLQNNPSKNDKIVDQVIGSTPTYRENGDDSNSASIIPIVQVFKDHNCTNDDINTGKEYIRQSNILDEKIATYDENIVSDNFGAKEPQYKGATDFRIETRANTNNEGYYYYSTESSPTTKNYHFEDQEGISRLVASTQDLITNDDLLRINHSAEKHVSDILDEYTKPRHRYHLRSEESHNHRNPQNQITVKAKIRNIENRAVEYSSNTDNKILQNDYDNSKFASPIVVQDSSYDDYKQQVLDTLVSTMTPFIENGYVIASITNNSNQNYTKAYVPNYFNGDTVYVTPRPVGQKYLAPITVALRLLNSNHTEIFNSVDDHDTSDTEFVEKAVKYPPKGRTIVEIQESIPLDITHINEVEVHEYLDEGRSNVPFHQARNLHNVYIQDHSKRNNVQNINEMTEYGTKNVERLNVDGNEVKNNYERNEKLEPSENMETHVAVEYKNNNDNEQNNNNKVENKNENIYGKRNVNNPKVIQPIIVEKEVPVPQYIDRYIEKQVPYPEPKEVVKHIAVDRPVLVPVPYEKVVEKPVEVTKYIDKPYPVEVPQPYPVPIKVPYPVEQKVYIDRPVHVPYPVEKVVEKEIPVPVPTPVAVPVKVPVENPVIIPVPVEKPYPVPVEKPVHVNIPVPIPVHIIKHYPFDRIIEKKVPFIFPIDRIVEKKVPYPVEKVVEKVVEKPVVVTKYVDKPYPVETKVPYIVENKMPYVFHIPAADNSGAKADESQNVPQYLQNQSQQTSFTVQNTSDKSQKEAYFNQLQQHLKDSQPQYTYSVPIHTTQWGNLYASTYKYVNVKPDFEAQRSQAYNKYLTNNKNLYYGPPPMQTYNNLWDKNNAYNTGIESNRSERKSKVTNLRIEYGFKPPLIPSTEVDLDGRPLNKESDR